MTFRGFIGTPGKGATSVNLLSNLLCKIGWHNWLLHHVDQDARPPVGYVACEDCGRERPTFYDGSLRA